MCGLVCPTCKDQGLKSKVRFVGDNRAIEPPWDYDEEGNIIERQIRVSIECDKGHITNALLRGILEKARQI